MTAFREGGGVPYAANKDFHATMAEESGEVFDADLVDTILPLADGLPARLREWDDGAVDTAAWVHALPRSPGTA